MPYLDFFWEYVNHYFALFSVVVISLFGSVAPLAIPAVVTSGATTAAVVQVIDGDTIEVLLAGASTTTRVRYIGIDTPEPYVTGDPECGSKAASTRNAELVENQVVTIVPGTDPADQYGRLLAYVYVNELFVNETLVTEGFATVMMLAPNTEYHSTFQAHYVKARAEKIGIWAVCE